MEHINGADNQVMGIVFIVLVFIIITLLIKDYIDKKER